MSSDGDLLGAFEDHDPAGIRNALDAVPVLPIAFVTSATLEPPSFAPINISTHLSSITSAFFAPNTRGGSGSEFISFVRFKLPVRRQYRVNYLFGECP